jgi:RHS repeat-associated protein
LTLTASLVGQVPALAALSRPGAPGPASKSVPVGAVKAKAPARSQSDGPGVTSFDRKAFPAGGTDVVPVSGAAAAVGGLPVTLDAATPSGNDALRPGRKLPAAAPDQPSSVRVQVGDQAAAKAAGVAGVLMALSRTDTVATSGRVHLQVDYSQFVNAFGANYGSRLRLVALPGCALTTPARRECQRQTPLPSVNRETTTTVSADVDVAADAAVAAPTASPSAAPAQAQPASPMVVALASSASSPNGDFTATSLSPSYSWTAGNQGGSFGYSYPLKVPASLGGPSPQLALSYDSGSVDGQTVAQNGQAPWVGEGWNLEPGYIERSYRPCAQDGNQTGDLCWFSQYNATMVFGGRSVRLVRDQNSGAWRASDDSGLKIEQIMGAGYQTEGDNGSDQHEYWKVTALDGTQYFFGVNWRYYGDKTPTNSTLTEPVFSNNSGEPCWRGSYASSACWMGYRWNLDYVIDPRGNSMSYFYNKYQGSYGAQNGAVMARYDMASILDHIDYGTRYRSEGTQQAPQRVWFYGSSRCINTCSQNSDYPDTPMDLYCATNATSCQQTSMTYFSPYKLSTVVTLVLDGSGYRRVDQWDLNYTYPPSGDYILPAGDDTSPNLWLQSITHSGYSPDGRTASEPAMTFGQVRLPNRVNWGNDIGVAPYMHYRISSIRTGSGSETTVTYANVECGRDFAPQPAANPNRCFPVYFKPTTSPAGWDWFQKFVVSDVAVRDLTGGSPDETWHYDYSTAGSSDPSLWRHDFNESVQLAYRSWTQWLGYTTVTTTHGPAGGPQTVSRTVYQRGLDNDGLPSTDNQSMVWGTRRVGITMPLTTPNAYTFIGGQGGQCLNIAGASTANGALLETWDCTGQWNQVFRYRSGDQTMRNPQTGKCVNIVGATTASGARIEMWDCTGGWNQVWQRQPDGSLRNPQSGKCLDVSGWGTENGTPIQLWDCNGQWSQIWLPRVDGSLFSAQTGRCLDAPDLGANGKVQSWRCNYTGPQLWQLRTDGSLFSAYSSRCLDPAGGATAAGTQVQTVDCTGAASQRWQAQPDGTVKNVASGRCLDLSGPSGNGQPAQLADCTGSTTQKWTGQVQDGEGTQGFIRDQQSLDGGQVVSSTIHEPSVVQTAARPTPSANGEYMVARMLTETATRARTWIAATNTWRWAETDTAYDNYGLATDVKNLGDTSTNADDTCTHTDYAARDTNRWMIDYPKQTYITNCAASPTSSDYLTGTQYWYDAQTTWGATPTNGLVTTTKALVAAVGTPWNWKQASRTDYDSYGRPVAGYDALDRKTQMGYIPATGGPVTASSVTNALGWAATTTVDPGKGTPTSVVDVNGKATTAEYDPLGRLTKVWRNNRPTTATPDSQYTYTLSDTAPNSVQTQKLGPAGQQISAYAIYDGRLRPRQTQTPAPQAVGGRVVSETVYDGRGLPVKSSTLWNSASGPTGTLVAANDADVVNQHRFSYDNLQRQTVDGLYSNNTLKWQTTTTYEGDRSTVTPPAGGTPTTTISDARGKTTTLRQYLGGAPSGSFQDTVYSYDRLDRQTGVTDPAGNRWTTSYDLRGRVTQTTDPDKGTTTSTYDDAGELTTSKDARGVLLAYKYDTLGRKTELWQDAIGTGNRLADWTYDNLDNGTILKGQLAKSSRYSGADAYSSIITGYDDAYRPLGTTVRIPAAETGLAGDWTTRTTYNVDGSPATVTYPAAAGLGAETVTTTYDNVGLPLTQAGLDTYVADTQYYYWGTVKQQLLGTAPKQVKLTTGTDEATGRLTQLSTSTQTDATPFAEKLTENYTYNPAGQVTNIAETNAGNLVSNQCFTYDGLQQLTEAWATPATTCQASPTQTAVGGPDSYWTSYRYDTIGNRTRDTTHDPAGDTTRTYTYPAAGAARPHAVTSVAITGAATGNNTYAYDQTGNTATRNIGSKPGQTLTWSTLGQLKTVTDGTNTSSYIYDASGNRLIAHDSTGTTLYLGGTEVHRDSAGAISCTRFYGSTAVRTNPGGLTWLAADHHGTGQLAINSSDLTSTRRKTDPFGNPRGTQPTWPTTHGFVNGVTDPTGLTHLGAREYDPAIGRFISVDPILDVADPQQTNGYSYANNNPTTGSDPTGLRNCSDPVDCAGDPTKGNPGFGNGTTPDSSYTDPNTGYNFYQPRPQREPSRSGGTPTLTPDQQAAYDNAKKVKKQTVVDVLIDQGLKFVLDLIGVTDIVDCFTKGDLLACGSAALNFIPWTKALKVGKDIFKALTRGFEAYKTWQKAVKVAEEVIARTKTLLGLGCHSFDPATPVLMANGSRKAIKDVKVGDKVVSTDPDTGQTTIRTVTTLHLNNDTDLTDVTVTDTAGHAQTLHTTQHHPFFDDTTHTWVDAADLQTGHQLRSTDHAVLSIATIRNFTGQHQMRDLTVADIHTYYVVAGNTPVLVHNVDECRIAEQTLGPKGPAEGVSAARGDRVSPDEQRMVNEFGDRNGCSTCPADKSGYLDGHWTGDHQPANKLAPEGPWTLYPQCGACARQQGGIVNGINRGWYEFGPEP